MKPQISVSATGTWTKRSPSGDFYIFTTMEKGTLSTALEILGWVTIIVVGVFMLKILSLAL